MHTWLWRIVSAVLFLAAPAAWAKTEFMKVDEVQPGMKGIGKTCYEGGKPEEFQVEILGVLRGLSPGASAVLARLSGGPLEKTGVFEGMSGSPVFIDGKLLGAVAFSFPFAKEAIGGITPIQQMVNAFTETGEGGPAGSGILLKKSMLWQHLLESPGASGSLLLPPELRPQPRPIAAGAHALMPIATPLALGGFNAEAVQAFMGDLRAMGLSVMQGAGVSGLQTGGAAKRRQTAVESPPLEPGSNIVVPLVRGDLEASAGGTVTYVDGDQVYAFGHQFFNLGHTELPMHKGRAITLLPNLQSSFKILETGEPVGTIVQDRNSGVFGTTGQKARMVPMQVRLSTSRGVKRELKYEIVRDRFLTPFLVNFTVFNTIISSERSMGVSTLRVKGRISIKGEQPIVIENRYSSDSNSPAFASLSVTLPIFFLFSSGYRDLDLQGVDLEITAAEEDRAALLEMVRVDRAEIRPGETMNLDLSYRRANGQLAEETFPVKVPADVTPGPIALMIADGANLMAVDSREQGDELIPRDLSQLIKWINNLRRNDHLYVRLYRRESGAVVRGEGLPGLPPSVLSILRSDRSAGGMNPIHTAAYLEFELPSSDYIVTGAKTVQLQIKP